MNQPDDHSTVKLANTSTVISKPTTSKTIKLGQMRVSPSAQRKWSENRSYRMANDLDLNRLGVITVSQRDGFYWIVDGQHRYYALQERLKRDFGDNWRDWEIEADCYEGLTEQEEAIKFLEMNEAVLPTAFDKFIVSVKANRSPATEINDIVESLGLKISRGKGADHIAAVVALQNAYKIGGEPLLIATLTTIRDAWDSRGYDENVIYGLTRFISRYEGHFKMDRLVDRLSKLRNGSRGLQQEATRIRDRTGSTVKDSVAAAIVSIYNKGLTGNSKMKLPSWWSLTDD